MRLTEEVKRPELTERKYKAINACYYNSPGACANKCGRYEDIDEDPEHLAKIKRAFDIIKNSGYISIDIMLSQNYITRKEYDFLKEVLSDGQ